MLVFFSPKVRKSGEITQNYETFSAVFFSYFCSFPYFCWTSLGDTKCSGQPKCEVDVHELIKYSRPCPVELSSYLEASFTCVSGEAKFTILICASKLCRWGMFRKGFLSDWSPRVVQIFNTLSVGIVILSGNQLLMLAWLVDELLP